MSKLNAKNYVRIIGASTAIGISIAIWHFVGAAAVFAPNAQPIGEIGQPVLTKYDVSTGLEKTFIGQYNNVDWSGNLLCFPVSASGVLGTTTPCWGAGGAEAIIATQGSAGRSIGTLSDNSVPGTLDTAPTRVPFAFASLAAAQKATINANEVAYIRGDQTNELPTGTLRTRGSIFGDVVHARPVYMDDTIAPDGTARATPEPTVFIGSNDGMLHAINATSGAERWAYIPSMLIPKLRSLTSAAYQHDYFVDGGLELASKINTGLLSGYKNILVGTLGAGGKGIYALDVSTMSAATDQAAANKILWEITPSSVTNSTRSTGSYTNLGDTFSRPSVAKTNSSQDVVIVGNGYNNTGNGHAVLYVINILDGTLIKEIDTGSGVAGAPNGLSTPRVIDINGDGKADFAYAGDIDGNMWKFNLQSASPASWTASLLFTTSPAQAITVKPAVTSHPSGGYMVEFATGRMLSAADKTDNATFYAYGIWDGAPSVNAGNLQTQIVTQKVYRSQAGSTVTLKGRSATNNPMNWSATTGNSVGHQGWKVALPNAGERVIGESPFIANGRYYFNTYNPLVAGNNPANQNWLMELDYLTGGSQIATFIDMNGDGVIDETTDRFKYEVGDTLPTTTPATVVGDPIATELGVIVGVATEVGAQSQPTFVTLSNKNGLVMYNYNTNTNTGGTVTTPGTTGTPGTPAVPPTTTTVTTTSRGIGGGHFDVENFYDPALAPTPPTGGPVMDVNVTNGGSGYTSAPTVTFSGGSGSGLTAVANISPGAVTAVSINNSGTGYVSAPVATFSGGGGSGAAATVAIAPVPVTGLNLISAGTGYTSNPTVALTGCNGSGATATASLSLPSMTAAQNSRGNNYTSTPTVTVNGGGGTGATAVATVPTTGNNRNKVTAVTITLPPGGGGYTSAPTLSFSGGGGSGASYTVNFVPGTMNLNLTNAGSGYTCAPAVTITGGGGSGASATASINTTLVITLTNGGIGYTSNPTISLSGGGGTGATATATATRAGTVQSVTITNAGSGYTGTPSVTFSGGGGSGASASTVLVSNKRYNCPAILSNSTGAYDCQIHFHEYDKIYDTNGVNFLNASDPVLNLSRAIDAITPFKVLVMNQSWNRSMEVKVGSQGWLSLHGYQQVAFDAASWAAMPVYVGNNETNGTPTAGQQRIANLAVHMPSDAFQVKDWWSDGVSQTGVTPLKPQCVANTIAPGRNGIPNPQTNQEKANGGGGASYTGLTGERNDRSFTFQLVRANTPITALEANSTTGYANGSRVKASLIKDYVLAEFVVFWHHPNDLCDGDSGWTMTPPLDTTPADPTVNLQSPPGSGDPKDFSFLSAYVPPTTTTTQVTVTPGTPAVPAASGTPSTTTACTPGTLGCNAKTCTPGTTGCSNGETPIEKVQAGISGRVSWHELIAE